MSTITLIVFTIVWNAWEYETPRESAVLPITCGCKGACWAVNICCIWGVWVPGKAHKRWGSYISEKKITFFTMKFSKI